MTRQRSHYYKVVSRYWPVIVFTELVCHLLHVTTELVVILSMSRQNWLSSSPCHDRTGLSSSPCHDRTGCHLLHVTTELVVIFSMSRHNWLSSSPCHDITGLSSSPCHDRTSCHILHVTTVLVDGGVVHTKPFVIDTYFSVDSALSSSPSLYNPELVDACVCGTPKTSLLHTCFTRR